MNKFTKATTLTVLAVGASALMANTLKIENATPAKGPIEVRYQIVHVTKDGKVHYGPKTDSKITSQIDLHRKLAKNDKYVGIITDGITVKGKYIALPTWVQDWQQKRSCSLVTDVKHPVGIVKFAMHKDSSGHSMNCGKEGGVV